MSIENRFRARLRWATAAAVALAVGGCSDGGSTPTSPTPPPVVAAQAAFRIAGEGIDQSLSFSSGPNLVFCRSNAGWADLWIRFAEQTANDGNNGPRLDIDLCNLGNGGHFTPMDPQAASCSGGKTWGVWWHDADGTFANRVASQPCALTIDRNGSVLSGDFHCAGLAELEGDRALDLLDGTFQCSIQ